MKKRVPALSYFLFAFMLSARSVWAGGETRYIFFMTGESDGISIQYPDRITPDRFKTIMANFSGLPDSQVKVGLSCIFSYFQYPPDKVALALRNYLQASEQTGTPITVKLDGEQWWNARPDLWNWWDPSKPGYDPKNAYNVEWTGWDPQHALKIAWRDWGRQIRVAPPPNLASPAYRRACHEAMQPLLKTILEWQKSLPPEKKDLLVAIEVGWESAIGVNAFYPKNGNAYLERPAKDDPNFKKERSNLLNRGGETQGYAAACTSGIRTSGRLRYADQVEVVRRHLADLARFVSNTGFPRSMIFTHGWGNEEGEPMYDAAVNKYSCPGWSCYWYSNRLKEDKGITRGIKESNAPYWAAVEWLFLHRFEEKPWKEAFENTLFYKNCRYLCFYNWNKIARSDKGKDLIQAVREVMVDHKRK